MRKFYYLLIFMVGLLCAQTAKAQKTAKAILTYEAGIADSTLTFVYDAKEYTIGGKYNNVTILNVWDPTEVDKNPIPAEYIAAYPDVLIADIPEWIQFSEEPMPNMSYSPNFPYKSDIIYVKEVKFDSSFKDARPTSCDIWFWRCYNLNSFIGLKNLNTSSVTTMCCMFENTSSTSLDISHFDTQNCTNMRGMFNGCNALTSLDVSNFNTTNVTDMYCMFYACKKLTSLELTSSFNTMNVTTMNRMFASCNNLTSLDLSYFNTRKVTDMEHMFNSCRELTSITISDGWNTDAVTKSTNMFYNDKKLIGEKGTTYDANKIDLTYAHGDEGTSNPGYMTLIDDVHQVSISSAGMATMYYDQALNIHPDVETWYCRSINDESCIVLAFPILTTIPANTGVFFTGNSGSYLFPKAVGEAANVPTIDKNILVGSMTDTDVEYKSVLTLGHDQEGKLGFWYFTGTTIPAEKAYIPKAAVSADEPRAAARSYTIVFNEEGENQPTGISNVTVEKRNDGKIYNLNGQQVKNPTKGLYIINGKKVILK